MRFDPEVPSNTPHSIQERVREEYKEFYVPGPIAYHVGLISKWLKYLLKTPRYLRVLQDSIIEMPFSMILARLLSLNHQWYLLLTSLLLMLVPQRRECGKEIAATGSSKKGLSLQVETTHYIACRFARTIY